MKWIKASDFKSDKEETVFAKWEDTGEKFFAIYRPGRGITNISGFHLNKVLVVDESEPSFTLDEAIDIYIYIRMVLILEYNTNRVQITFLMKLFISKPNSTSIYKTTTKSINFY